MICKYFLPLGRLPFYFVDIFSPLLLPQNNYHHIFQVANGKGEKGPISGEKQFIIKVDVPPCGLFEF